MKVAWSDDILYLNDFTVAWKLCSWRPSCFHQSNWSLVSTTLVVISFCSYHNQHCGKMFVNSILTLFRFVAHFRIDITNGQDLVFWVATAIHHTFYLDAKMTSTRDCVQAFLGSTMYKYGSSFFCKTKFF